MKTKIAAKMSKRSFVAGVLVGLLFGLGSFFLTPKPQPIITERVVVKTVTKTKIVSKTVTTPGVLVKDEKIYRAQSLNPDGTVKAEWIVKRCKFKVVGATLTDLAGHTFTVQGNIRIEPMQ